MVFEGDPHRTLGLTPGATQAEIKAAYRRLAKAFHPDTAGEAAIPRFLAIQAAYEVLTGTTVAGSWRADQRASRADPDRARAARDGWRGRAAGGAARSRAKPRPGDGAGASRTEGRSDAGTRSRPRRDRAPNRATPGSTTYDTADEEPFDPEWSGASWYGTTSGTYWTINPKEYADPRKHGPEYQARGRRHAGEPQEAEQAEPAEPAAEEAAADEAAADGAGASAEARRNRRAEPRVRAPRPFAAAATGSQREPQRAFRPAVPVYGRSTRRVALALIGWPPLGVFIATLIGEASGCSRFAAGCDEGARIAIWIAQLLVVATLLAIPRLAAISSVGTLVALAAAVPATLLLSVSGGAQERAASVAVLSTVLAVAYLGGVVFAVLGASRTLRT